MTGNTKKDIIFAIPSYNEADSIAHLTKVIDKGLSKYFPGRSAVIVNADNDSPDNTRGAFLSTGTRHEKVYLTSRGKPRLLRGKGYHLRMVFEYALRVRADAVGFIDGDVTSASPEWVRDMLRPILKGYDHVLPVYLRNEYDGAITNHLVFPALYGLLSSDIRQPLAGEIALSQKALRLFLSKKWYPAAFHYGVDIFLVTHSIFSNLRIAQTFLGVKDHKLSAPKLDAMFLEVADSLMNQLVSHRGQWKKRTMPQKTVPLLTRPQRSYHAPSIPVDYKRFRESTLRDYRGRRALILRRWKPFARDIDEAFTANAHFAMTPELWAKTVYFMLAKIAPPLRTEDLKALRPLFFARFLTFYQDVLYKTHEESEREIMRQADVFRKMRGMAV